MPVELTPITDADVAAVAKFLHANLDDQVPWDRAISSMPWKVETPNHGFMLRDGQRVVGTQLAFYSERLIAGRVERFCSLSSWCVLPDSRLHSIRLLRAVLAQDGYHFTSLTPVKKVVSINTQFKFRFLDPSAVFIPNLPWPTLPARTKVSADPDVIESTLAGTELELYRDHAQALAARHVVLVRGQDSCYVMYREMRHKGVPFAAILHVSNPELFHRAMIPLTRHLLIRHRLLGTLAELRFIGHRPPLSLKVNSWTKMYRSDSLEPGQIDDLYSELVCLPWPYW
ncbi:MAG TPA: hypothetical protein VF060_06125 [Trebonia sp.]